MGTKNIRHVGIVVDNLEKALHFYCDLLGFQVYKQEHQKGQWLFNLLGIKDLIYVKLKLENYQMIELYYFPTKLDDKDEITRQFSSGGFNHIAITVDNVEEVYEKLKKENLYIKNIPILDLSATHKLFFCRDYFGNLLEIVEEL